MKDEKVSIGIMGAGAMGCLFAWLFHRGGIETAIYETDRRKLDAMKNGITLRTGETGMTIPATVSDDPAIIRNANFLLVSVKSYSTESAIAAVKDHLPDSCIVVTLQNGMGNVETLCMHIPRERLVYGTTLLGATLVSPGIVVPGGEGETVIGGDNASTVEKTLSLFESCGISVRKTDEPDRALWEKAVVNAAINPLGALMGVPNGEIIGSPHLLLMQELVVEEASHAAAAAGIPLDAASLLVRTRDTCLKTSPNLCSMLQDVMNMRKTEIDSINGAIIRTGNRHGLQTPVNETLYLLIKAIEELYAPATAPDTK